MYKKVLYNIKKMKKCVGGGGGAIFEPKPLSMYLKKKNLAAIVNIVYLIVEDLREDWQCPTEYPL